MCGKECAINAVHHKPRHLSVEVGESGPARRSLAEVGDVERMHICILRPWRGGGTEAWIWDMRKVFYACVDGDTT